MEHARRLRGASLSGGLPRQGEQDGGLHSKSLRPCPGRRVEKPRRLSSKASTGAAVRRRCAFAAERTSATCLSQVQRREEWG